MPAPLYSADLIREVNQDTGFSTIPRLGAFLATFLLALPWMLQKITTYTVQILGDLSRYAR